MRAEPSSLKWVRSGIENRFVEKMNLVGRFGGTAGGSQMRCGSE